MFRPALALAAAIFSLAATGSMAAQDSASAALPGRVGPTSLNQRDARLSKAEASKMAAEVERVLFSPLLATPALADPRGFAISRQLIIAPPPDGLPRSAPSIAHGHMLLRSIDVGHGSKRDAAGAYNGVGEGPGIQFTINDPSALFPWPVNEEGRPAFYDLDPTPELRHGFPVLRFRTREHIVIARPGRKPYRHVTKAEVLAREIGDRGIVLEKFGANEAPGLEQEQAKQQAELAALSPAELMAPACLGNSRNRGTFTPCSDSSAHYVVAIDPSYFDPTLPKTAIQLITLVAGAPHRDEHKELGPVTRAAVAAMDLAALQRALR